ncbi:GIY-YIG nuclease family protein [Nocardioides sp. GY 10127]|uniref:GIY-YIG nuclease family protein n=1 Tax=Nocardioides sp. GY 10127 TaxID=2569762 RepID=UPI0010A914B7|nr:GIY-YIG nuclease family protein [Nocardioides sp. GY 10127]TIC86385.1 GIY-YIG nuclease family protein [Nocardioides sp. GY 10127]
MTSSTPDGSFLTFADLLGLAGIDSEDVRLVRHQDGRLRPGRLHEAWRQDAGAFEQYQATQARETWPVGCRLASFIVTEARKTVFVGLYRVDGVGSAETGSLDVLTGADVSGHLQYDLVLLNDLAAYRDRVVIDWGAGTRSWVQRAANQPKPILEIADQSEPRFPGFREFVRPVEDVPTLPPGWQQVLRSVKGVYLLVDMDSGQQYVGSAKGADSLYGRWLQYATDGHGGNVGLRKAGEHGRRRYQVSVLEVVDENTPDTTIEQIESYWKNKLLTRTFGLNVN